MKVLVLGGNNFFGKKFVAKLIDSKHDVTLLNRGRQDDGFGSKVKRVQCDRDDVEAMTQCLEDTAWDVVVDQICYNRDQALQGCELFKGKTKKLIFTSTTSVYLPGGANLIEADFDPSKYNISKTPVSEIQYSAGKREAEAVFVNKATFPVVMLRFPIVIGEDDVTRRTHWHVNKIKNKQPMYFFNVNAKVSFISSDDAAKALLFACESEVTGALNACSPTPIMIGDLLQEIAKTVGEVPIFTDNPTDENTSSYGFEQDWWMNSEKLNSAGLTLSEITTWLPTAVKHILEN